MDGHWSSLQSQIALVYLLDKHPLPYLGPTTLFQTFFEVFPYTQRKKIYKNVAHLFDELQNKTPHHLVVPPPLPSFSSLTHLTSHVPD